MLDTTQSVVAVAVSGAALLATIVGWLRWVRPRVKRWAWEKQAKNDVLIGRPAVLDSITGKELSPALPGVGVRMDMLTEAVAKIADTHARIEDHETRIQHLEQSYVERVASKAESAAAWRAMEAAALAQPDEVADQD